MNTPESYSQIGRRPLDIEDYFDVARRHTGWIMAPLFAGLVIAIIVAFVIPNTYVSQASLRITPPRISQNILPTDLNQQMADRISQMEADIMSRTSLSELIQRPNLDLYKRKRQRMNLDDVIEDMRKDLKISLINIAGQGGRPASAFNISFAYSDRFKARDVVAVLVSKFTEANLAQQRVTGEVTKGFIDDEVNQAKAELDRLNGELTEFRIRNSGVLPEQAQMNVTELTTLQSQRGSLDEAVNRSSTDKIMLENQIQSLKTQRETLSALYTPADDPAQAAKSDRVKELNKMIADTETKLQGFRELYTDSHPDIQAFTAQLESLKKQRDLAIREEQKQIEASAKSPRKGPSNPALAKTLSDIDVQTEQAKARLRAVETDRANRLRQIDATNHLISQYQARLETGPANQQKYSQLISDQHVAELKFQELEHRQSLAKQSSSAQDRNAGENLEVLDNASLPETPSAPNRLLIIGIGVGIGLMAGISLTALREMKDTSLKNLKDVRAYTQLPILASIPLLENDALVQRRRRMAYVSWSAAVIIGMVGIAISMYYHFIVAKS